MRTSQRVASAHYFDTRNLDARATRGGHDATREIPADRHRAEVNTHGSQTVVARLPAVVTYLAQWRDPTLLATVISRMTGLVSLIPESTGVQPVPRQPVAGQLFKTEATADVTATTVDARPPVSRGRLRRRRGSGARRGRLRQHRSVRSIALSMVGIAPTTWSSRCPPGLGMLSGSAASAHGTQLLEAVSSVASSRTARIHIGPSRPSRATAPA